MYNFTTNDSLQRRQSDPTRYAIEGGRIFEVNALQNSQTNDGARVFSSNAVVQTSVAGGMFLNQPIPNFGSIPIQINSNQSAEQRRMASTSTSGLDYRYIAPAPAVQQQPQSMALPEQQRRSVSYPSAPEPSLPQHVRQSQLAPPSNWPLTAPRPQAPPFSASVRQHRPVMSGGHPQGYVAPSPQMAPPQAPATVFANSPNGGPPTTFPNPVPSTSTREPVARLPLPTVPEAEAALVPVRTALEALWGTITSAHTTALAKERDAHIASVKALNDERKTNARLQVHLSTQLKIQHDLRAAAKGDSTLSEETMRRLHSAIEAAREEGRNQGSKEGRQELNALQLDFEGVQAELTEQKNLVARLKTETERLQSTLRGSSRLVVHSDQEMLRLLLEIPPTRQDAVPPQSPEDKARMRALLQGVDAVQLKLSELRQTKQKVADLVQMVNMDLLALVDNWTRRGSDVLLSSRWKKAWTAAAINGQGSIRSSRRRPSVAASGSTTATTISPRKDSITTHPLVLAYSQNGSLPVSSSPSTLPSISRKVSVASSATLISTPLLATALPSSGSSHDTPIDVDIEDACDQIPSTILAPPAKPLSPTTKYRSLLDFIAEARQDFRLPTMSESPIAVTETGTDTLTSTSAQQDYRSMYGLMALPPTPRYFNDPDPSDPDYDTHSVPRLSPPLEESMLACEEPSLVLREQRGWRLHTPSAASTPGSPTTPAAKESSAHVPSSPCLLKDVMPLKRVDLAEANFASPMTVDVVAPICLGAVSVPPVINVINTNDAGVGSITSGKRTRAEFEEGQGIQESGSRSGSFETERKRRPPLRPSLPPILVKPEPLDAVFDQTAALSLDGTPVPEDEQEMDELEGGAYGPDTTELTLKQESLDDSQAMLVHNSEQPSLDSASTEEREPRISNSVTPTPTIDDLEEGELTPDTPAQRTLLSPMSAATVVMPITANLTRKNRPVPDMIRRTRPSDHTPPPVTPSSATRPQSPSRPPKPVNTKLGISHIDLLYRTSGHNLVCRMCETRPRDGETRMLTVARYPDNAPWDTLIGHCRREHPVACEELERKKPSDIAELRQRLPGARFGRS